MKAKIELGDVQETLLIPLYGRARDAAANRSVLADTRAIELVDAIDYDFTRFTGPSLPGSVLRASIFDQYVRDFLADHPDGTVVDLGCGLSTRFDRLDNGSVRWFDLDLPDTMALRRRFFTDSERYTMIDGSIFDEDWYEAVAERGGPVFLLSEAVLLYFAREEVEDVLGRLARRFGGNRLAVDTGGRFMMGHQDQNPVFRSIPARMQWVCDDPRTLEPIGLRLLESRTFAHPQKAVAGTWPWKYRLGLAAIGFTPMVSGYRMNLFTA
ncbi:class I SAM-dependent methyltransferase [Tsukamurella pseudospumae]|uniref:Methyltransferase n=1 Tax=Tsukamurella pseudospumae TaxID=239498 RepID=A0A138A3H0_9ACTN|nr:class I SAM-dependent methyltransferase [Tsukamurella pseudospumae]KXO98659.1 methyltransferase [Tsukamurella pseudospumae]KXP04979.1 methyltransferase [Tsukamurella pseudospumae]